MESTTGINYGGLQYQPRQHYQTESQKLLQEAKQKIQKELLSIGVYHSILNDYGSSAYKIQ